LSFLLSQPQQVFCPWCSSFDVWSFKEKLQESRVADTVINRCPDRGDVFRVRASCNEAAVALKAMKLLDCSPLVDYKIMTAVDG
jgi:pyruvate-formate lyase-activating enzyme